MAWQEASRFFQAGNRNFSWRPVAGGLADCPRKLLGLQFLGPARSKRFVITVALAKGALLQDSIACLQAAGLDFTALTTPGNRQLMVDSPCGRACALLVRNADVPVYVAYGQAQLGVVGDDVLREHPQELARLADLGFGGCRMAVAVKHSSPYRRAADLPAHCRVASKFIHCARTFFDSLDLPVDLIQLQGSVELGPLTGMSEAIVDLVATGRTLQENGLVAIEDLFFSTARLVGNPLALRMDRGRLQEVVEAVRHGVRSQSRQP